MRWCSRWFLGLPPGKRRGYGERRVVRVRRRIQGDDRAQRIRWWRIQGGGGLAAIRGGAVCCCWWCGLGVYRRGKRKGWRGGWDALAAIRAAAG